MTQNLPDAISLSDLDAVERPIAAASGMPNAAYTDLELHKFERDHLFAKTWTAVAFCDDHRNENMVTPLDFMGLPLLVISNPHGSPTVFHNVCSHRGTRLVNAPKKTNGLLVCPYHSWSYDLSGTLKATPCIGGPDIHQAEGFCREKHGLKPVRSHCWMGVLFVNLSADASPFNEHAAPLIERYQHYIGADGAAALAPPQADSGLSLQANCNWKLAVENYCEAYHLPWIHPSLNTYSPLSRHYCMLISDDFAGQGTNTFNPVIDGEETLPIFPDWPKDKYEIAEYPVFYPNLLLGFQVNHFYALIIHPLGINRVREDLRIFYVGEGATDRYQTSRKSNLQTWQKVFREDVNAVEEMQLGRNSPGFRGGVFSPTMDTSTHHFHQWVARKYRAAYQAV